MAKFKCCVAPRTDYIQVSLEATTVGFDVCSLTDQIVFLDAESIRALRKQLKKYLIAIEENDPERNGDSN